MYAIAYDFHAEAAERYDAYRKVARILEGFGFRRQQGSVFYGTSSKMAMTCAAAVLAISDQCAWFWEVVRDMRMLRIDEEDDLLSIVPHRLRFDQRDIA